MCIIIYTMAIMFLLITNLPLEYDKMQGLISAICCYCQLCTHVYSTIAPMQHYNMVPLTIDHCVLCSFYGNKIKILFQAIHVHTNCIAKYSSTLYRGMDEVLAHYACTFDYYCFSL